MSARIDSRAPLRLAPAARRDGALLDLDRLDLRAWHGLLLCVLLVVALALVSGGAAAENGRPTMEVMEIPIGILAIEPYIGREMTEALAWTWNEILARLWKWTVPIEDRPSLATGFLMNMLISVLSMAIGTILGVLAGMGRLSGTVAVRGPSWLVTEFLRNTPSIVFLFYLVAVFPNEVRLDWGALGLAGMGTTTLLIEPWVKATIGLSLPVIGFMSDNTYAVLQSIDQGQWDAGRVVGLTRGQTLRMVILPQTVTMLVPPWVNYFAIIIMASSTASLVGVAEIVSAANLALDSEAMPALAIPMYLYVMLWFFAFCYPMTLITEFLNNRRKRRIG